MIELSQPNQPIKVKVRSSSVQKVIMNIILLALTIAVFYIAGTQGHGMLLQPPGRSSRWRYNSSAPANYDDNGLFCGGYGTQWGTYDGKCGLCGDSYGLSTPRPNELGGRYGEGVIVQTYQSSSTAQLGFQITANHLGYIYFNLCNLDAYGAESEECFLQNRLKLVDGSDKLYVGSATGWFYATVVLPKDLVCEHCVLRWTYRCGNNWGWCGDGTGAMGCGSQEHFLSCADISITA